MTILRLHLFGGLMMSWEGTPLPPIAGTVARSQVAHLRTYRDQPHTCHLPAGTFWPDLPDDLARRRLSQALGQIRKALNPHPILLTEGDTVRIPLLCLPGSMHWNAGSVIKGIPPAKEEGTMPNRRRRASTGMLLVQVGSLLTDSPIELAQTAVC